MAETSSRQFSRRQFLAQTAAVSAFTIVPSHVLAQTEGTPPSEKLNIAGVGIGGKGYSDLTSVEADANIVALCDVDDRAGRRAFERYPKARKFKDFRVMLDKISDIDGVIVATPDHTHAVVSMAAIKRGKHVYTQKPLTHTVYEARTLAKAARKHKV
ncbi:MAG: Gfo/Idh/MocA family oxidoreductase, partial [Planctomycetes bacterium]|nr:Gfo/Idh/MocA family oxidoreductase [Planctomycetota bacterium]